jgi:hypothetical protein
VREHGEELGRAVVGANFRGVVLPSSTPRDPSSKQLFEILISAYPRERG